MKRVIIAALWVAGNIYAQGFSQIPPASSGSVPATVFNTATTYTIGGTLPAASGATGQTLVVSNGANGTDCSTGGGAVFVPCRSNGTTWVSLPSAGAAAVAGGSSGQVQLNSGGGLAGVTVLTTANGGTGAASITGLRKANGASADTAATAGTDYVIPSGNVATATSAAGLNGTALSGLATGILKNTTATGVPVIATAGTDYVIPSGTVANATNATTATNFSGSLAGDVTGLQGASVVSRINGTTLSSLSTGILKNTTSSGVPSIAVAGTDYVLPSGTVANATNAATATSFSGSLVGDVSGVQTSTVVNKINGTALSGLPTGLLKNTTSTGVPSIATAGTDYVTPGGTVANATTAVSFSGGLGGDVSGAQGSTSVNKINGTALSGLATGILKNTTSTGVPVIATAGTDYVIPSGNVATATSAAGLNGTALSGLATGLLKNTTSTGVPVIATSGTDYVIPGGNVATATALASVPAQCSGVNFSTGITASGVANCTAIGASAIGPTTYAADSGAANAYVIAPSPAVTSLAAGVSITFTTTHANTSASTINVNGLGVKNLTKNGSVALASGDILSGAIYQAIYDGTQWELNNPSTGVAGTVIIANDLAGSATAPQVQAMTPLTFTTSTLPSVSAYSGREIEVSNGANGSDCATGGGAYYVKCRSNGTSWFAVGNGSTGTATATALGIAKVPNSTTANASGLNIDGSGNLTYPTHTIQNLGAALTDCVAFGGTPTVDVTAIINAANAETVIFPENQVCGVAGSAAVSVAFHSNTKYIFNGTTLYNLPGAANIPIVNDSGHANVVLDRPRFDFAGQPHGSWPGTVSGVPQTATTALTCSGGSGFPNYATVQMNFSGGGGSNLSGIMTTNGSGACALVTLTYPGTSYTSTPTATATCPSGWSGCVQPTFTWATSIIPYPSTNSTNNSAQLVFNGDTNLRIIDPIITNTGGTASAETIFTNAFTFITGTSGEMDNAQFDSTVGGYDVYINPLIGTTASNIMNEQTKVFKLIGGDYDGSQTNGIILQSTTANVPDVKVEIAGVNIGCRTGRWTYTGTLTGTTAAAGTTLTMSTADGAFFPVGTPFLLPAHTGDTIETVGFLVTANNGAGVVTFTPAVTNQHTSGQTVVYPFQVYGVSDASGNNGPNGNAIDVYQVAGAFIHDNQACEPRFSGVRVAGTGGYNTLIHHNKVLYPGETGIYTADVGAYGNTASENIMIRGEIQDTNVSTRPGGSTSPPTDAPSLIINNYFQDADFEAIHAEHAFVSGNTIQDAVVGISVGIGGTGHDIHVQGNHFEDTALAGPNPVMAMRVSNGLTSATNTLGNFLEGNSVTGSKYPQLNVYPLYTFDGSICGMTNANPAVLTICGTNGSGFPTINVNDVYFIRGADSVNITPNATSGKYPGLSGSLCGVTVVGTGTNFAVTCGGGQTLPNGGQSVAALDTTHFTPLRVAPAGNNNPTLSSIFCSSGSCGNTWPKQVQFVRDNSTGFRSAPTLTVGAALGTGSPTAVATTPGSSDSLTQVVITIGTTPTTGTAVTGTFAYPTSAFANPSCFLTGSASMLAAYNLTATLPTRTGWTLTAGTTAISGTINVNCKLD